MSNSGYVYGPFYTIGANCYPQPEFFFKKDLRIKS